MKPRCALSLNANPSTSGGALSQRQQKLEPIDDSPYGLVAGVDEVGIGPLAGDVVACAVILDANAPISGLRDSKRLSDKARERLAENICAQALSWSLGSASVAEVDSLNVLVASHWRCARGSGFVCCTDTVLVDGNKTPDFVFRPTQSSKAINVSAISATSIVAKVTRIDSLWNSLPFPVMALNNTRATQLSCICRRSQSWSLRGA